LQCVSTKDDMIARPSRGSTCLPAGRGWDPVDNWQTFPCLSSRTCFGIYKIDILVWIPASAGMTQNVVFSWCGVYCSWGDIRQPCL